MKTEIEKLKAGKTTFKSVFSSGTKTDQIQELEEDVAKSEKVEEALGKMIFLMNAANYHEIEQYKQKRASEYPENVHEISKKQIKEMDFYGQLLAIPLGGFMEWQEGWLVANNFQYQLYQICKSLLHHTNIPRLLISFTLFVH